MRTHYRNGDEISLNGCDGCNPSMIQGVLCHELGCPDAWRDTRKECRECGCDFYRTDRWQAQCQDCIDGDAAMDAEELPEDDDDEDDSTVWCSNCDSEAVCNVIHHDNGNLECPLCFTCKTAYEWGQASPNASVVDINDTENKEANDA